MRTFIFLFILTACASAAEVFADQGIDPQFQTLAKMFDYDDKQPLDIREVGVRTKDGVQIHDITYASPVHGRVAAYLLVPEGKAPFAGIVFGHWGLGTRAEFLPDATLYARAGAVSLLIDYPWDRPEPWRRNVNNFEKPEKDREAFVQATIDARRGIDLLRSRPDVDGNRIAYVGHSYGAQWGAILSAIDKRLKTVVLMGGAGAQKDMLVDSDDPEIVEFVKGLPKGQLEGYLKEAGKADAILYISHSDPMPVLFQFANYERYFNKASMERYYEMAGNPKVVKWYDTGHDLNDISAFLDRSEWLRKYIGIGPVRICD
jgi:dienelactone hydrolase